MEFIDEIGGGPGVRLRQPKGTKQAPRTRSGAQGRAYDPVGMTQTRGVLPGGTMATPLLVLRGADDLVIIAEWQQFRAGYLARFKPTWPVDVDLRKIYPPTIMGKLINNGHQIPLAVQGLTDIGR